MEWAEWAQFALTSAIGVVVAYLAVQQYRTDRHRLKNELFDKRYKLYEAAQRLIIDCMNFGTLDDEKYSRFRAEVSSCQFVLSDARAIEYLGLLKKESLRLLDLLDAINDLPDGPELEAKKKERRELAKWFREQPDVIGQVFLRDLKLGA